MATRKDDAMDIKEFMRVTREVNETGSGFTYQSIRPRIVCKNGVSLSVQGSHTHYCSPREDGCDYYMVEVGYPSIRPPNEWAQYYDGTWQAPGLRGSLLRVWKDRGTIWRILFGKNWAGCRRLIRHWVSLADNATTSVYAWVPIELVQRFVDDNGGMDEVATQAAHDHGQD